MRNKAGKISASVIAVILISVMFATTVFAQDYLYNYRTREYDIKMNPGWNKLVDQVGDTYWYYGDSNGDMVTGWKKIDGKWYAFMGMWNEPVDKRLVVFGMTGAIPETNGSMIKGTVVALYNPTLQDDIEADFYSFESSGAMATGWKYSQNRKAWFYHDPVSGKAVSGWRKIDGSWYYFTEKYVGEEYMFKVLKGCEMKTGWLSYKGGWYYLAPSGAMQTGWVKVGSNWYYMSPSGEMQTGWVKVGSSWYCLDTNGAMITGWYCNNGKWYYLGTDGAMQTGWVRVGGNWYYMDPSGVMLTGWQKIGGRWYCFNTNGTMITGWYRYNGTWYYFGSDGAMVTGWLKVGGIWYFFKPGGGMACNEWYGGYWFGNDGAWTYQPHGGWVKDDRGWRYQDDSGWCATNETIIIDGVPYTFDPDGYWIEDDISDWVVYTQVPVDVEIIDTKWEYTFTQYTSSASSTKPGWELYRTDPVWGDYGGWSEWSTEYAASSDSREVQTMSREICTLEGFCCGDSSGNRCYLAYMQDGYTLRSAYGQRTVTRDELNSWQTIPQGGVYDYAANVYGYIVGPGTAYIHPSEMVPFFIVGTSNETLYRYRDRSISSYTYWFRRSERRTSYTDPTGQEGVSNVVKYVRYRIK